MILYSCSYVVSSMARVSEVKNGLRMSETIRLTVVDCWERKLRATRLGRYSNCSTAVITRSRTSGRTWRPLESTRDTVAVDTPAALATSLILAIHFSPSFSEVSYTFCLIITYLREICY